MSVPTADEAAVNLRQATLLGVRWIAISRVCAETAALASTVVLSRLIPPAAFGHAVVAIAVVALVASVPSGLTAPLVQRRSLEPEHVGAATVLSLVVGVATTALMLVFAETAGARIFGTDIARLLELAAPALMIGAVGAVPQAMLQRELRFRWLALLDSTSVVLGTVVAIILAVLGLGATAIVVGGLVTFAAATLLSLVAAPPARLRLSRRGFADIGGFAFFQSASGLAYSAFLNVDYAILGARMAAAQVGFYWRAYQLGVLYQAKISQIMLRVAFPVYSRTKRREDILRLRMRIVRIHAAVLVPILCAFIAVAPIAIPAIFGAAWKPAVTPAQVMAIAGMGDALLTGIGPLLSALGRPGVLLGADTCQFIAYGLVIYLLAPHGLIAVCIGVAAFSVVTVVAMQVLLLRPIVGLPHRQFVAEALPGFVVGACVLVTLTALREALDGLLGMPAAAALPILALAGAVVYVAVLKSIFNETWSDLLSIVKRVGSGSRSARVNEQPVRRQAPTAAS